MSAAAEGSLKPQKRRGRAYGRIAALPPVDQGESARFVVLLDNRRTVVACLEDRKGSQWGCAAEDAGT